MGCGASKKGLASGEPGGESWGYEVKSKPVAERYVKAS